jgi:hypothetical protein
VTKSAFMQLYWRMMSVPQDDPVMYYPTKEMADRVADDMGAAGYTRPRVGVYCNRKRVRA